MEERLGLELGAQEDKVYIPGLFDLIQVDRHADAKLKGFGAWTRLRNGWERTMNGERWRNVSCHSRLSRGLSSLQVNELIVEFLTLPLPPDDVLSSIQKSPILTIHFLPTTCLLSSNNPNHVQLCIVPSQADVEEAQKEETVHSTVTS